MTSTTMTARPAPGMSDALVVSTVPAALRLAAAVRDHDVDQAHEILTGLSPTTLQALAVALATLAPEDACVDDVLVYCAPETRARYATDPAQWSDERCRTSHAAFVRRVRTPKVEAGEIEYQRRRYARRKYLADVNAQAMRIHDQKVTGAPGAVS